MAGSRRLGHLSRTEAYVPGLGRHPDVTGLSPAGVAGQLRSWQTGGLRAKEVLGRWTAVSVAPAEVERPETEEKAVPDSPWVTIVWNDPVNLMSYVTYVFQTGFGY